MAGNANQNESFAGMQPGMGTLVNLGQAAAATAVAYTATGAINQNNTLVDLNHASVKIEATIDKPEKFAKWIEHEFGRNIAKEISKHLQRWKKGEDAREPVSRFLRTYSIYLFDHLNKENKFFDQAEAEVLSKEEETEMYEQYRSVTAITKKKEDMIKEIDFLENQPWFQI